jgi:cardiolipin synthase
MERVYAADLANSTEIVLRRRTRVRPRTPRVTAGGVRGPRGSAGRAAAGALRLGNVVGAALAQRKTLGPAESRLMAVAGAISLVFGVLLFFFPRLIAYPLAFLAAWIAITLLLQARKLRRDGRDRPPLPPPSGGASKPPREVEPPGHS